MKKLKKVLGVIICIALVLSNSWSSILADENAPSEEPQSVESEQLNQSVSAPEEGNLTLDEEAADDSDGEAVEDVEASEKGGGGATAEQPEASNKKPEASEDGDSEEAAEQPEASNKKPEAPEAGDGEETAEQPEASEDGDGEETAEQPEEGESKTPAKETFKAGTLTAKTKGYEITLSFDASSEIPENAKLDVKEISADSAEYDAFVEKAAETVTEKNTDASTLPYARFFDITILDSNGAKVEPKANVSVKIDLKDRALETEDVDFAAVHFTGTKEAKKDGTPQVTKDTEAEVVEISTTNEGTKAAESTVAFDADSFSVYGVVYYYTVDFYYTSKDAGEGAKPAEYHMNGGSEMMMSELFGKLGISRKVSDIAKVDFTDESLVKFTKEGSGSGADYRITSLQPFTTSETLTITFTDGEVILIGVEDAVVRSGYSGSVRWEIDDAGVLTLKPDTRDGISNPGMLGQNSNTATPSWGWYRYHTEVKEIKVEPGVYTQANAVALFGADNSAGVYPNLKKVDLSGLDISRAQQLQRMFSNVKNLEEVDLSVMANKEAKNLYNMSNLFNGCSNLKNVNLSGIRTRIIGESGATQGCTMNNVFKGCDNLQTVDMSNVRLGGRTDDREYDPRGVQMWFQNLTQLTSVKMDNAEFPDMPYFNYMFDGCTALKEIDMSNVDVSDAEYMRNMFSGCTALETLDVSGFGQLEKIVNMDGFVYGDTSLKTLNMDNLGNSAIGPYNTRHSINDDDAQITGAQDYGRMLNLETCTALKTLSAKNSKVWMTYNNRGLPGSEYYNASDDDNPVYYFTDKAMTFDADAGAKGVVIDSDRDYIDLIIDRDGADNKHTTNPAKDPLPDAGTNINIKDGDLNTNGPGFLAPGVYTLDGTRSDPDHAPMEDTYYRIAYVGEKPYTVEWPDGGIDGLVKVEDDSHNYVTINTTMTTWNRRGDRVIDCGSGIKITYKDVAIDCNGKLHDVIVTINKITFKDLNKVPYMDDSIGGVSYGQRKHDYNVSNYKVLDSGQAYYRPVLQAQKDGIVLLNYIRAGTGADPTNPGSGIQMLTGGSGTDIDFTIEIDKANDDTSFVFLARDLDVAYSQDWEYNSNGDACYDNLPIRNVTYGAGGEGFVFGDGVRTNTVQFAEETGLYTATVDGKTNVLTTGGDPNTPWSEFTVTGDAKGANFTWTSGIGCTSYILENTVEQDLGEITIQPQVLKKLINGTLSAGDFEFKLEKVSTEPDGAPEPSGGTTTPTAVPQTKTNDASGNVAFDALVYKTDGANEKIYGSDSINYFPGTDPSGNTSGGGKHNTITYTYKVTEVQPATPDPEIIYDTSEHEIKIVISTPENDTEMKQGIKAEVYADGTLVDTYWHSVSYNTVATGALTDKWYDASGAEISNPNPITLDDITFKNTQIKPAEVKIPAQKILEGRPWKDSDQFAAALTLSGDDTSTPMPENSTLIEGLPYSEITIDNTGTPVEKGGRIVGYQKDFGVITYKMSDIRSTNPTATEKTFSYHVRELEPSETTLPSIPGVTYDTAPATAEVTVKYDETDPDNPKLTATVKYFNEAGEELTIPEFTNTYDAEQTAYKMEALKILHKVGEGGLTVESLSGGEFDFVLKPIGDNAAIAPMPKNTQGTGADRTYTKTNEDDGDIQFEVESDPDDGLIFNYQALLAAGVSDEALHSDDGVDFDYEMYEVIPDGAVNNNDGTWTLEKVESGVKTVNIYDGVHHTRTITVKVRTNDNDTPTDPSDDFDELYILGHKDIHEGDYFINADGAKTSVDDIEGYDVNANHFKEYAAGEEGDLGAPIFLNYIYEQPNGSIEIIKEWDDADDQDKIRPDKVTASITADDDEVEVDDVDIEGEEWKATVEELPVYTFSAKYTEEDQKLEKITYTVAEGAVDNYDTTYDPDPAEFQFSASDDYKVQLTVTNSHTPEPGEVTGDETWGARGEVQTGKPDYEKNPNNPVTPTNLVKPEVEGATISEDGKTVTIPGEGEYVLKDDGTITFTPEDDFVGDPTPITVEGKDLQENTISATYTPHVVDITEDGEAKRTVHFTRETKDGEKVTDDVVQTATLTRHATTLKRDVEGKPVKDEDGNFVADTWGDWSVVTFPAVDNPDEEAGEDWYTNDKVEALEVTEPGETEETVIYYKKPAADEKKTYGGRGRIQKGTPPFEEGSKKITGYTLIDPKTGNPAPDNKITVDGEGTYEVDPETGEVTFTPEYDFVGVGTTVTVRATDEDGNTADGKYTPTVVDTIEQVTKTRKITYVYEDGSPVLDEKGNPRVEIYEMTFERDGEVDPDTGEIISRPDWNPVDIPEVTSPTVDGYTPDKASVSEVKGASPDNWPKDEVVTYKKNADPEGPTWIDGKPYETVDKVGKTQKGTLKFKPGKDSPIDRVRLIDPATGKETDSLSVDVYENGKKIGTYKLNPTGKENKGGTVSYEITFTPEGDYTGTPKPITLRVYDVNGKYADGIYQPKVVGEDTPVSPTPKKDTGVKTGDETNIAIWIVVLVAAIALIGVLLGIRRKKK